MPAILYISFDLYGTLMRYDDLARSWQDWRTMLHSHTARLGVTLGAEDFDAVCRGFFAGNPPTVKGLSVFECRLRLLAEHLGLAIQDHDLVRLADDCCQAWQQSISLDSRCIDTLEYLAAHYTLFLVSNFDHPRHVRRLLDKLRLTTLFREVLISGEHGVKKPNPALFAPLRAQYQIQPWECAHVGDSLEDYEFAINSRMVPVMLGNERYINKRIDYMEREICTIYDAHHASTMDQLIPLFAMLGSHSI